MASRLIFKPNSSATGIFFEEVLIEFEWVPGMAVSQGRKSVENLHKSVIANYDIRNILEISTRSQSKLGVDLSAFNLKIELGGRSYPVESAYQSSKYFFNGGPFVDLLSASSLESKKDIRLKNSGQIKGFRFEGVDWPLTSSPNFYDYIYIRALLDNPNRIKLMDFEAFSDIAYSQNSLISKPGKSFNCQARSAAIYVAMRNIMDEDKILPALCEIAKLARDVEGQLELF
jgi:hypothetical protein